MFMWPLHSASTSDTFLTNTKICRISLSLQSCSQNWVIAIVFSICDSCLMISDHWILISCNTFLQAARASSCDITANNKVIKMFLLVCKCSIINRYWLWIQSQEDHNTSLVVLMKVMSCTESKNCLPPYVAVISISSSAEIHFPIYSAAP